MRESLFDRFRRPRTVAFQQETKPGQELADFIMQFAGEAAAFLFVDGQEPVPITKEHRVTVRRAPVTFGLVKVPGRSYYQTLRDKLRWGTQPNYRSEPPAIAGNPKSRSPARK